MTIPSAGSEYEPLPPEGWATAFFDDWGHPKLKTGYWRIQRQGAGYDRALIRCGSGLALGVVRNGAGAFRMGGIQLGSAEAEGLSWTDLQVSICCRYDEGLGVGGRVRLVPYDGAKPVFTFAEPVGRGKSAALYTLRTACNGDGVKANRPLDMTKWHVFTVLRQAGKWRTWIDGQEQPLPMSFVDEGKPAPLTVAISAAVGGAAGQADTTTPEMYSARYAWIRVVAPRT